MFELSIALHYLLPKRKQLSVSIITLISTLVIALVVWLILLFFSVTNGLEKNWIDKLTALTAPVRVTPKESYYNSHYYQVDGISEASDYTLKSIAEKRIAESANPYDPEIDSEAPGTWPAPLFDGKGHERDLVKELFATLGTLGNKYPGLKANDYEVTAANLKLRVVRDLLSSDSVEKDPEQGQGFLSQATYLGSLDGDNPRLSRSLLPLTSEDLTNLLAMQTVTSSNVREEMPKAILAEDRKKVKEQLQQFFHSVTIEELKTPKQGWLIPKQLLPSSGKLNVLLLQQQGTPLAYLVSKQAKQLTSLRETKKQEGYTAEIVTLDLKKPLSLPLILEENTSFPATLSTESLETAQASQELRFFASIPLQGHQLSGEISLSHLSIGKAKSQNTYTETPSTTPLWHYQVNGSFYLPNNPDRGEGVLLPKSFRDAGILVGDQGFLSYQTATASSVQEQRVPIIVAGFYDQGIIPIGGKYLLVNREITSLIRASNPMENPAESNGVNVRFDNLSQTEALKGELSIALEEKGLSPYWKVESYHEYEFTKDLIAQLHSDKNLFLLIATLIIIVACSNIISMLIILVNDKKQEIGILRAMGASSLSIATIFGSCGIFMGMVGSLIGILAALFTLKHLDLLVQFFSHIQGYQAFNPLFYGESLPNTISTEALIFVLVATASLSLFAGIIPAVKASLLRPAAILRAE